LLLDVATQLAGAVRLCNERSQPEVTLLHSSFTRFLDLPAGQQLD